MFLSDMCVVSGNYGMVNAYAKINLTLDVTGKRPDGYHDILTIMRSVNLYDTVSAELKQDRGIELTTNLSWLPTDSGNIAYRAAEAVIKQTGASCGVKIHIQKRIPCGAGMGGGSADGAAVIALLNRLLGNKLCDEQLLEIGAKIGADVPFCLMCGTCVASGIGEKLEKVDAKGTVPVLIVKPQVSISTAEMYRTLDDCVIQKRPCTEQMKKALENGNVHDIAANLCNVMEPPAILQHSIIEDIKKEMISGGAVGAMMTGSGSAVFGVFDSQKNADMCAWRFIQQYDDVYSVSMI